MSDIKSRRNAGTPTQPPTTAPAARGKKAATTAQPENASTTAQPKDVRDTTSAPRGRASFAPTPALAKPLIDLRPLVPSLGKSALSRPSLPGNLLQLAHTAFHGTVLAALKQGSTRVAESTYRPAFHRAVRAVIGKRYADTHDAALRARVTSLFQNSATGRTNIQAPPMAVMGHFYRALDVMVANQALAARVATLANGFAQKSADFQAPALATMQRFRGALDATSHPHITRLMGVVSTLEKDASEAAKGRLSALSAVLRKFHRDVDSNT